MQKQNEQDRKKKEFPLTKFLGNEYPYRIGWFMIEILIYLGMISGLLTIITKIID